MMLTRLIRYFLFLPLLGLGPGGIFGGGKGGSGSFSGPAISVDGDLVEFDGVDGKKGKDSGLTHAGVAAAIAAAHPPVTVSPPISLSGQALSLVNNAGSPAPVTAIDVGALANSDTVIPTSKAVTTAIAGISAAGLFDINITGDLEPAAAGLTDQYFELDVNNDVMPKAA